MGDNILIITFVVIIIGGVGSIGGAFVAALLVGLIDTLGRSLATMLLTTILSPPFANQIGPALASMLIYIIMAAILIFRPKGLLPAKGVA
jgi:branched-chain amino acid transport system permease protein